MKRAKGNQLMLLMIKEGRMESSSWPRAYAMSRARGKGTNDSNQQLDLELSTIQQLEPRGG
jgi:hypothetical protein